MTTQPDPAPTAVLDVAAGADPVAIPANRIPELLAPYTPSDEERHRPHSWAQSPNSCRVCRENYMEDERDREVEQAATIDRLTCNLVDNVGTALIEVRKAQHAIRMLMGTTVYDVEFAEGDDGRDVEDELAVAARALRNVERIAIHRREVALEDDRAAKDRNVAEVQPGDEGTCGHAVYPNDPFNDVMCMLAPHGIDVRHEGWSTGQNPSAGTDSQA